ncbi:MAG: outer membrane lipoprotein chaperone LolA [Chromatiales bacterium]|nr:outer membrane lipoprotein chaperone LolA [Chromatiales bacterium]
MKSALVGLTALLMLGLSNIAVAAGGLERLNEFLSNAHTLQAQFQQEVLDENQESIQSASGTLAIERPGRFRWDYVAPNKQVIVADGERIWVYDADLEQVTIRPQSQALEDTPAQLLSGGDDWQTQFTAEELPDSDGLNRVELTPKSKQGNFAKLLLGFGPGDLREMEMIDSFGQITRFAFSQVRRNQPLGDSLFQFQPPPGVDIVQ